MSEAKFSPGPIERAGTFLWQMDSPSGSGINLWSGKLDANNGYPREHAERAAKLFAASPALYEALKLCAAVCAGETMNKNGLINALEKARAALSLAEGKEQA